MDLRIKGRTMCWDVSSSVDHAPVVLFNCHGMKGNQFWKYNVVRRTHLYDHHVQWWLPQSVWPISQCTVCGRYLSVLCVADTSVYCARPVLTAFDTWTFHSFGFGISCAILLIFPDHKYSQLLWKSLCMSKNGQYGIYFAPHHQHRVLKVWNIGTSVSFLLLVVAEHYQCPSQWWHHQCPSQWWHHQCDMYPLSLLCRTVISSTIRSPISVSTATVIRRSYSCRSVTTILSPRNGVSRRWIPRPSRSCGMSDCTKLKSVQHSSLSHSLSHSLSVCLSVCLSIFTFLLLLVTIYYVTI